MHGSQAPWLFFHSKKQLQTLQDVLQIDFKYKIFSFSDMPLERNYWGMVIGVFGMIFMTVDVGSDAWLTYVYHQDASVGASNKISASCKYEYYNCQLNWYSPRTWNISYSCREELRNATGMVKLFIRNRDSTRYMWATLSVLALGALIQTIIITVLACRGNQTFSHLPKIVKILTFIAGPLMMGPLPMTAHLTVRCWKGIGKNELTKYKVLISTIKMGEVVCEALPQLIINSASLNLRCGGIDIGQLYKSIPVVQWISILTSTFTVCYGSSNWLLKKRKEYFISKKYHPLSSFLGIFSWEILGVAATYTGVVNINLAMNNTGWSWIGPIRLIPGIIGGTLTIYIVCFSQIVSLIFILTSSCTTAKCGRRVKFVAVLVYLINGVVLLSLFTQVYILTKYTPLAVTLGLFSGHILVGILILPSADVGAAVFDVFLWMLFAVLRPICTCTGSIKIIQELEHWEKANILTFSSDEEGWIDAKEAGITQRQPPTSYENQNLSHDEGGMIDVIKAPNIGQQPESLIRSQRMLEDEEGLIDVDEACINGEQPPTSCDNQSVSDNEEGLVAVNDITNAGYHPSSSNKDQSFSDGVKLIDVNKVANSGHQPLNSSHKQCKSDEKEGYTDVKEVENSGHD